jgi:hemin uptake protein HemP
MATDDHLHPPPARRLANERVPAGADPAAVAVPRPGRQFPRSFTSADLFGAGTEIEIAHQGAIYLLKITRQGKLILNK